MGNTDGYRPWKHYRQSVPTITYGKTPAVSIIVKPKKPQINYGGITTVNKPVVQPINYGGVTIVNKPKKPDIRKSVQDLYKERLVNQSTAQLRSNPNILSISSDGSTIVYKSTATSIPRTRERHVSQDGRTIVYEKSEGIPIQPPTRFTSKDGSTTSSEKTSATPIPISTTPALIPESMKQIERNLKMIEQMKTIPTIRKNAKFGSKTWYFDDWKTGDRGGGAGSQFGYLLQKDEAWIKAKEANHIRITESEAQKHLDDIFNKNKK